jgi:hypothetical protein
MGIINEVAINTIWIFRTHIELGWVQIDSKTRSIAQFPEIHKCKGADFPYSSPGRLRPPTGPPSVLSRVESVERMRDAALVRHGYTHRERAVLWGTSLQQYEALHLGLNTDLDSPSLVGTLSSCVPATCAWGWVGGWVGGG